MKVESLKKSEKDKVWKIRKDEAGSILIGHFWVRSRFAGLIRETLGFSLLRLCFSQYFTYIFYFDNQYSIVNTDHIT